MSVLERLSNNARKYLTLAIAIAPVLAWHDVIQTLIGKIVKLPKDSIGSKAMYAVIVTLIIMMVMMIMKSDGEQVEEEFVAY